MALADRTLKKRVPSAGAFIYIRRVYICDSPISYEISLDVCKVLYKRIVKLLILFKT